ncbi:MAG TPA: cysteine synthase [Candidatus Acidoferrales bacterium]|nr:cysteine synthase [Candidatus Acidoferrales bacterium]
MSNPANNPAAPAAREAKSASAPRPHAAAKPAFASAIGEQLLDRIGHTPLLRLGRIAAVNPHASIFAKAEWFNPGGSVKDRAAYSMICDGIHRGALREGKTILDATSGNTGIAYAMIGAALGYPVKLCLPTSASEERKKVLETYGVEIVFTPGDEGTDGAIRRVREIHDADPEKYFYPDQYSNPANPAAHYNGTALEIWEQSAGKITHFVTGLGTTGTFIGTSRRLRELNPRIRCISVQPDSSFHGLEGMKHIPTAIVPKIYDPALADENIEVRTEDAQELVRRLAREEGVLAGVSSGAALWASLEIAKRATREDPAVIVTIFPDSGERYLSDRFWSEE